MKLHARLSACSYRLYHTNPSATCSAFRSVYTTSYEYQFETHNSVIIINETSEKTFEIIIIVMDR